MGRLAADIPADTKTKATTHEPREIHQSHTTPTTTYE